MITNPEDPYIQDAGGIVTVEHGEKFNQSHDARGRFSSGGGGGHMTTDAQRKTAISKLKVGQDVTVKYGGKEPRNIVGKVTSIERHGGVNMTGTHTYTGGKLKGKTKIGPFQINSTDSRIHGIS